MSISCTLIDINGVEDDRDFPFTVSDLITTCKEVGRWTHKRPWTPALCQLSHPRVGTARHGCHLLGHGTVWPRNRDPRNDPRWSPNTSRRGWGATRL